MSSADGPASAARTARFSRATNETTISGTLNLDGSGTAAVATGIPFFDHMLDQLARHGGWDLTVEVKGDIEVDDHHTVEDTALCLGAAFAEAVGDKVGIARFASGLFPLDEAVSEVVLDLSGRPFAAIELDVAGRPGLGTPPFNPEMAVHFLESFATAGAMTLHVTQRSGKNTHHIVESAFKGVARCLRTAVRRESDQLPSTKGVL